MRVWNNKIVMAKFHKRRILRDPGQSVRLGEKARWKFSSTSGKPLGTDSHWTISKQSSECWLLIICKLKTGEVLYVFSIGFHFHSFNIFAGFLSPSHVFFVLKTHRLRTIEETLQPNNKAPRRTLTLFWFLYFFFDDVTWRKTHKSSVTVSQAASFPHKYTIDQPHFQASKPSFNDLSWFTTCKSYLIFAASCLFCFACFLS